MLPVKEASYAGREFNIRTIPHAINKIVTYDGEQKSATLQLCNSATLQLCNSLHWSEPKCACGCP
jgi:hypothetical protein